MSQLEYYDPACKKGLRSYRAAIGKGRYPYLPVLEEILANTDIVNEVSLGNTEIPLSRVKGTFTAGRRTAFAPDFMPLLSPSTEFAGKWNRLAEYHLREGIQDPVIVYEYMGSYYVLEGNKRVSVLKHFGARSVYASVTRLIPQRNDTKENRVYYEYLDFYKKCPENYMTFSEPGDYGLFLSLSGISPEHKWTEEELLDLRSLYVRFAAGYEKLYENREDVPSPSDALLTFLGFYGYRESIDMAPSSFRENIEKIRDEIELKSKGEAVELLLDPEEGQKKNFLERLLSGNRTLKIAFLYARTPDTSAWTYGHELGRLTLQEELKDQVETSAYENLVPGEKLESVIEEIIAGGTDIIFATTPVFMEACLKAAAMHPDVKILCCALNASHRYLRTYYARLYEAKFLSGIIAGSLSENGRVGYLADYPIPGTLSALNAFARGVSMVNPGAKVFLQWSSLKGSNPETFFNENNVRIISGRDYINPSDESREFGLYRLTGNGRENLAMAVYDWGILYKRLVVSIENGAFEDIDKTSGKKALNYWWGMDADVVDLLISGHVPESTRRLADFLKEHVRTGALSPFDGLSYLSSAVSNKDGHRRPEPMEIATMDRLYENIVGSIPQPEELSEDAKVLLSVQGLPEETEGTV